MTALSFAHLSDIHISSLGNHDELLSGQAAAILARLVAALNAQPELEFVLISGDLFDQADRGELEQFQRVIAGLEKPCYIIPGNHDRRPADSQAGLTRREFAEWFNPQVNARPTAPADQAGYWSVAIRPNVQLIGLDSIRDRDWGGEIDAPQLAWLAAELAEHADKLIILTVHHPLHRLAPVDDLPEWRHFVCDTGPELLARLDRHPAVKLVLTGHHHFSKVDQLGRRLHIATPSICMYPCAYRTLRLSSQTEGRWRIEWHSQPTVDAETMALAEKLMLEAWQQAGFSRDFVEEHIELARGTETDRNGSVVI
ncbi:MAG TPA: metallophosphoesterase [Anaerolineae bacterium]|nr:metallophosphoesterase [Anaerolineae bacterium]